MRPRSSRYLPLSGLRGRGSDGRGGRGGGLGRRGGMGRDRGAEDEDGGDEEDLALGLSRRLVRDYGVNTLAGRIRVDPGVLV